MQARRSRLECAGNRKTVEVGRIGFVGMRVRRTPPRNCLWQRFGMRRTKKPLDTAPALCFALLPSYNCPPAVPAGCSVAMRKDALLFSLNTRVSVLHRFIALRFGARFRSVSFWWQDKYPIRDTGCAEGKRMYLTSKNQNASMVRKVLAGLRVRRNEGDEEMW